MTLPGVVLTGILPVAALLSAVACLAWLRFARSQRLLDLPGGRRVHSRATPRGGGIGIALVMVAVFVGLGLASAAPAASLWSCLAAGTALLAMMGLADDLRPLSPLAKFAVQLLAVAVMLWPLQVLPAESLAGHWLLLLPAVILWVNIWNFMDGSHGLVAVQALLIALAVCLLPGQTPALRLAALALAGACIGFLPFNLPEARLFLGDVGSHALAAAVIGLLLTSVHYRTLSLPEALMLSSVLLVDALSTLARRLFAGKKLWRAHREHLYQFAVRRGFAPWRVCLGYGVLTVIAILIVFACRQAGDGGVPAYGVAGWGLVLALGHAMVRRRLLDRHREVRA